MRRISVSKATVALAWFVLCATAAFSQVTTADLIGTVEDTTGAAVPGASVTVTSLETHESKTAQTGTSGDYNFTLLKPGNYAVNITMTGFKTFQVGSVALAAGDRARVNGALELGAVTETVNVEARAAALQADSSSLVNGISEKAVQDLPLNGRNFVNLAQLTVGANEGPPNGLTSGNRPGDRRPSVSISVNGQSDVVNNILIDGLDDLERVIGTIGVRPSIDAIAEVRLQTNSYTAEVGRTAGSVINIITKAGTDKLHGTAYEFFRNDVLNAYPFEFGAQNRKPELRQNQFGGSVGGPLFAKNTFFFGDYEGLRLVQGQLPLTITVPTLYEHNHPGDFTDIGGTVTASPDPVGLAYLSVLPVPNVGTNQYVGSLNRIQNVSTADFRVDRNFGPKDFAFGRVSYNNIYTKTPGAFPQATFAGVPVAPCGGASAPYCGPAQDNAFNALITHDHTFNEKTVLELKGGYLHVFLNTNPDNVGTNPNTAAGQPNINVDSLTSALALVSVTGATSIGGGGVFTPVVDKDNTYQLAGSISRQQGRQSIKAGMSVIYRRFQNRQSNGSEGSWSFASYQTLAQGIFTSVTRSTQLNSPHYRSWEWAPYMQDDWHVSDKVTLNLGLRWELFTPFTEVANGISNFNPTTGVIVVAGQNGVSKTAGVQTFYKDFSPRIGFAYSATTTTVIRGGFGLSFFPNNTASTAALQNIPFIAAFGPCSSTTCAAPYQRLAAGLPLPVAQNPATPSGSIASSVDPHFLPSYVEQTNLTAQHDFRGNVFTASYVGMFGRHVRENVPDINAAPPNNSATPNTLRPYYATVPNLTQITQVRTSFASSYNALQLSFERRTKSGLTVGGNYTLAHGLDDASGNSGTQGAGDGVGEIPSLESTLDYGNSDLDIRNRIVFTTNYDLPFGKNSSGFAAAAKKGWSVNVLNVWSTGQPFTVTNSTNVSNTRPGVANSDRPNVIGSPQISSPGFNQFFNTAAFQRQAQGTLGVLFAPTNTIPALNPLVGPYLERRNQLYGPHQRHLDASVFKTVGLTEKLSLQLRAEMFNVANLTNFAVPNNSFTTAAPTATQTVAPVNTNPNFGKLVSTVPSYNPRLVQFAAKLIF